MERKPPPLISFAISPSEGENPEKHKATSEYLHQVFAAQGLKLLPEVELNSNDLLIDLAEIGLGIPSS